MTPELLRLYIDWLLKSRGAVVDPSFLFDLNAEFDKTITAGDIGEIRNLRISGKSAPQVINFESVSEKREVKTSRRIADAITEMIQAIPIVEAAFGKARAKSFIESLGPEEYLAVETSVKIRGRRTEASRKMFQAIANDIADETDTQVQIEGKDGQIRDGDAILRTRMPFHLPYEGSNLLEFDNVADQLQDVYSRFVKDGKIKS